MKLEISHKTDVDAYLTAHHYLHSAPAGARLRLWIKEGDAVIGAMMWGRPTARTYDPKRILELTRLYLIDDTEPFAESRALGMARRLIRRRFPEIKGLIAYSSTGMGHAGTIYLADGWFAVDTTRAAAWNREGRKNRDTSAKIRWVRTA